MITAQHLVFGRRYIEPNTFIGGMAGTITTASALATKLGISVGSITLFNIVGADIQAHITSSYIIPANCFSGNGITHYRDVAGKVTMITYGSFYQCTSLVEAIFPECTTITSGGSVSSQPFYQCTALTTLTIPKFSNNGGVGNNGHFQNCSALTSLNIPLFTGVIRAKMFSGMTNLATLTIGTITAIETSGIALCPALTTFNFSSVTTIGVTGVYGNTNLVNITNFNSVTSVGAQAFYQCSSLTAVNMPLCTTIDYQAFRGCTSVTDYTFPELLTVSGGGALGQHFYDALSCNIFYAPKLTQLSDSTGAQGVFTSIKTGCTITVDVSLATCAAGLPDGDLVYAADTRSCIINYAGTLPAYNTVIGNGSGHLNTQALIAIRLGISRSRITNVTTYYNNVRFAVIGTYTMKNFAFNNDNTFTFFDDFGGKCTNISTGSFSSMNNCKRLYLPALIKVARTPGNWSFQSSSNLKKIYAPIATWGDTVLQETDVFRSNFAGASKIYVAPVNMTSNSGGLEGDLAYAQGTLGCTIQSVTDFTAPSAVGTITLTTATATTLALSWSAPSSANTIDGYEVYVNGDLHTTVTGTIATITGLTTGTTYDVWIRCFDIYYNISISTTQQFNTL